MENITENGSVRDGGLDETKKKPKPAGQWHIKSAQKQINIED